MEEIKKFCPHCGGEIKEGENFCSYCGSQINAELFSIHELHEGCVANEQNNTIPLDDTIKYQKEDKPKKKSKLGRFVVLAVVIIVAIVGITNYNNYSKRINAVNAAGDFYNAVIADGPILENIANDIQSEWYEAIWGSKYNSVDDALKAATDKHADEIQNIMGNYSKITSLYQEASGQLGPLDDKQALYDAVKDLYNAYTDLYNGVIMFNCTYNEFCENFNAADQKAASAVSTLYALLQQ